LISFASKSAHPTGRDAQGVAAGLPNTDLAHAHVHEPARFVGIGRKLALKRRPSHFGELLAGDPSGADAIGWDRAHAPLVRQEPPVRAAFFVGEFSGAFIEIPPIEREPFQV
jgi:hypothetical protein